MSKFKKGQSGNPAGKPKGAKSKKTEQWNALHESILNLHTEEFNNYMVELWEGDMKRRDLAADFYLRILEYFKPKQSRVESSSKVDTELTIKNEVPDSGDFNPNIYGGTDTTTT